MKVQQFTGGLATRMRPQFLQTNEGVEYTNVDSLAGSLVPVKAKTLTTEVLDAFHTYYRAKDVWVSQTEPVDFLEYNKKLYSTNRKEEQRVFDGINTYKLGIDAPTELLDFQVSAHPEAVKDVKFESATNASGLPESDMYYLLVNSSDLGFSVPKEAKVAGNGTVSNVFVSLTHLPAASGSGEVIDEYRPEEAPSTDKRRITISGIEGITYGSQGVKVFRQYKGTYYLVGSLSNDTDTLVDSVENISGNTEYDRELPGVLAGTLQYAMTFVNLASGVESAPSVISEELELSDSGTISLTGLQVSADPQVSNKRLYRIGNNLTTLTRVAELANTTTNFDDVLGDLSAEGSLLTTAGDGPAPTSLTSLTEMHAMLYGAVGNRLVFTNIGEPWNWPATNYLLFNDDITGIASTANGLLVYTQFRTHLVTGTSPSTLATQLLSGDQGCIAFESVVNIGQAAMWASTDGICLSNGSDIVVVSKDKLGKLSLNPLSAVVHDEVYYLSNADGTIIAFDFSLGKIFKTFSLGVSMLAVANDKLYGWKANKQYHLFSSLAPEQFTYLSPRFIEGRATELKTYKKVYIYSKGVIIIDIIIDDKVVATSSFDGEDSHMIQVPQDKQRGFFIQFRVQGTGEVYEIEYIVGDRANG